MDQVQITVTDGSYKVIGGEFWEMLEKVKSIPGRKYERKVWTLPISLEEARKQLHPLQVVDEDALLEAEIADIQRVQARLLELRDAIERRVNTLDSEISRYSYRSKSSIKAGKAHDSALLYHALENASLPLEKLTEPQIKSMYAALREVEE